MASLRLGRKVLLLIFFRLEPHEDDNTDVVLLGHSMGGILCAEIALIPGRPATGKPFFHRILGTISFDTPFLGMHPGVVVSGIGSLFRPAPDPPGSKPSQTLTTGENTPSASTTSIQTSYASSSVGSRLGSETSTPLSPAQSITSPLATPVNDPFYNPPFPNDVRLPERKGWTNILHFINKHSDTLTSATKQYVMSHLEFGGCLADYPGLKTRYEKIRSLEDVDGRSHTGPGYRPPTRRVRFINYYTASTGRPKEPKEPKIPPGQMRDSEGNLQPIEVEMRDMTLTSANGTSSTGTPRISVEEHSGGAIIAKQVEEAPDTSPIAAQVQSLGEGSGVQNEVQENDIQDPPMMRHIESMPIENDDPFPTPQIRENRNVDEVVTTPATPAEPALPALPPIPAMPTEPDPIDLGIYTDKDDRKIAEKEQKRLIKVYQQAIKDRENAIRDRKKVVEKREKKAQQEREKQLKAEEKQRLKLEKEEEKRKATINPEPRERQASTSTGIEVSEKPKRDKKFCMLPPELGGKRDKCWVRVYMEGVDEVGAHCGLFFPGPQYESLVGDVGARIEAWVREDAR